ncbi:MAG: response regulator transcription factor, partial [Actinomycetota bacterium]
DVALLDADLPNCDGIRATQQISVRVPDCKVIVFSGQEDEQILVRALEAGASGYLSKGSPLAHLIDATRAVHRGEALVPPRMLGALLQRLILRRRERDGALRQMATLTRREREVLAYVAQGADNDMIAQHLVISPETARTHIQNVLGKLGVHSRLEAAAFVTQNGLLDDLAGAAT